MYETLLELCRAEPGGHGVKVLINLYVIGTLQFSKHDDFLGDTSFEIILSYADKMAASLWKLIYQHPDFIEFCNRHLILYIKALLLTANGESSFAVECLLTVPTPVTRFISLSDYYLIINECRYLHDPDNDHIRKVDLAFKKPICMKCGQVCDRIFETLPMLHGKFLCETCKSPDQSRMCCPICLNEEIALIASCGHGFCEACIRKLQKPGICPLCRSKWLNTFVLVPFDTIIKELFQAAEIDFE